jgi:hypothetical protein
MKTPLTEYFFEIEKRAQVLLEYPDNWDEEGSLATDRNTCLNVIRFVNTYVLIIFERYKLLLPVPYIDITPTGGLTVLWEKENVAFFIGFEKGIDNLASFYIKEKDNTSPKGSILIDSKPKEYLITWMKENIL